jgi:glycosyltransferase involved in cell wall biosynthesis
MNDHRNSLAVLIPCHNEESTIASVVSEFRQSLPHAGIYVYDNASTDQTAGVAREAGAIVYSEPKKGKGNVVRRMFADVDADMYVLVDGDATYDATVVPSMVQKMLGDNLDMVIGVRQAAKIEEAYRPGHVFGNWILSAMVSFIFKCEFSDMLSGLRVMSRRFIKSFPVLSSGFEIETEIAIHAAQVGASYGEVPTKYDSRPDGSNSKLNTYRDGCRILWMIVVLFKEHKPFIFFSLWFLVFSVSSVIFAYPLFLTWSETGLVPRIPTTVLCSGLMVLAFLSQSCGIILGSIGRARLEKKLIQYLAYPSVAHRCQK